RQPCVQRCEADLGAVAEQQEHEGDVEQRRIEGARTLDQHGPDHRVEALADDRPRRHVDEDGAEQRERDADAAEDEVFPRRLQRLVGAVDADHQHRRQRRELDRDPHQADVVGDERKVHREHQGLIHRVIEAQIGPRQAPGLQLMADVACREHGRGEAHGRRQHDEDGVWGVDQQIAAGRGTLEKQRKRRGEAQKRCQYVQCGREAVRRHESEQPRRDGGDQQYGRHCVEAERHHRRSPRKRSSAWTSTVSKRSRMRNRKIPITMKAIRIENAIEISTTSGMPLAPVAASTRPFSSDMKPMTWLTALRRVTIISRPRNTTASANARSSRASGSASAVTRSITTIDRATKPIPSNIAGPTPTTFSISRWMPRRTMIRCSATGITMALNTSAIAAVTYRCGASWI